MNMDKEAPMIDFTALDKDRNIPTAGKYGIVGIVEGIKQVAQFELFVEIGKTDELCAALEKSLRQFGLAFDKVSFGEMVPGSLGFDYYVAKNAATVGRAMMLREQMFEPGERGMAAERERGRMFGYPETAIDYFLGHEDSENPASDNQKYHSYIHSPEHAEEEYLQYEARLDAAFREKCPRSAEELL